MNNSERLSLWVRQNTSSPVSTRTTSSSGSPPLVASKPHTPSDQSGDAINSCILDSSEIEDEACVFEKPILFEANPTPQPQCEADLCLGSSEISHAESSDLLELLQMAQEAGFSVNAEYPYTMSQTEQKIDDLNATIARQGTELALMKSFIADLSKEAEHDRTRRLNSIWAKIEKLQVQPALLRPDAMKDLDSIGTTFVERLNLMNEVYATTFSVKQSRSMIDQMKQSNATLKERIDRSKETEIARVIQLLQSDLDSANVAISDKRKEFEAEIARKDAEIRQILVAIETRKRSANRSRRTNSNQNQKRDL